MLGKHAQPLFYDALPNALNVSHHSRRCCSFNGPIKERTVRIVVSSPFFSFSFALLRLICFSTLCACIYFSLAGKLNNDNSPFNCIALPACLFVLLIGIHASFLL
ncbi:hypothetical protein F5H01DRAFT_357858 [Linnemannia elongata]|nr:hypothetical protein F5H01DRAFT_357858 [Linnemannia elongata]